MMTTDKIKCPCCGFCTIDSDDEVIVEICDICLWQYDVTAHKYPDRVIGPNNISLNAAKENFLKFGVSKIEHIGKGMNRKPVMSDICE
jgi:hypothetical protein